MRAVALVAALVLSSLVVEPAQIAAAPRQAPPAAGSDQERRPPGLRPPTPTEERAFGARATSGPCAGRFEVGRGPSGSMCSHGPDYYDAGEYEAHGSDNGSRVGSRIPCYRDGPYVRIIYAYSGQNLLNAAAPNGLRALIREAVALADELFYDAARATGGYRRVRWKMNSDCRLLIPAMKTSNTSLGAMTQRALNSGKMKPSEHAVFFTIMYGCQGYGLLPDDSRPGRNNAANSGGLTAVVSTGCLSNGENVVPSAHVLAHELLHTLGAVQDNAPNSTRAGHCNDEWDTMCYQDGGSRDTMENVCTPKTYPEMLDCRKNDYFNVAPKSGSYLDRFWNTARSVYLARSAPARWDKLARPKVSLTGMITEGIVGGSFPVTTNVTAPSDAAIAEVDFFRDTNTFVGDDGTSPFTTSVNVSASKNGTTVTLWARVFDKYRRHASSAKRTATVANPMIRLTEPADHAIHTGGGFTWAADAQAVAPRTVAKVDLLTGSTVLDTDTEGPSYGGSVTGPVNLSANGLRARITDSAGSTRSTPVRVIDLVRPSVWFSESSVFGDTVNLLATAEPAPGSGTTIAKVDFYDDGGLVGTDTSGPDFRLTGFSPPAGGTDVRAVATDSSGGTSPVGWGPRVDPAMGTETVTLASPSQTSGNITLTATPSFGSSPVDAVRFYVDDTEVASDYDGSDGWSGVWDSTQAPDGPHIIRASADGYDADFNWYWASSAGTYLTTSNGGGASLAFTAPANGATVSGVAVPIAASAVETANQQIGMVTFVVNGTTIDWVSVATPSTTWDSTTRADGPVTLVAIADVTTTSGHSFRLVTSRVVQVSNVRTNVTAPSNGASLGADSVTLSATAVGDPDADVEWVRFYANGVLVGEAGTAPYSVTWNLGSVLPGTYDIKAVATLADGREAVDDDTTVTVT